MQQNKFIHKLACFLTTFMLLGGSLMASAPVMSTTLNTPAISLNSKESDTVNSYLQNIGSRYLLPRNLYILKGASSYTDRYSIYYRNVLFTLANTYNLSGYSSYGTSASGRWFAPTTNTAFPSQPFDLNFSANVNGNLFVQNTKVEFVDTTNQNPVRLLAIGDSLTRAGVYLSEVKEKLPNVTMLGTRFYPEDGIPAREGRGGWMLEDYFTFQNVRHLDSPFMFPVGVSGYNYKGNTRDWKNICYNNPSSPIYNGFQKLARGWKNSGAYLYDNNGYYKYPAKGDVMFNPDLPVGTQWIEWDGSIWAPMTQPPTEFEFNFTKYMVHNQAAFAAGSPTHVSILLGANEFGLNCKIDQMDTYIERLNTMIDSIHAYDPTIKIILCLPTLGPNPDLITSKDQDTYLRYNLCIKYTAARLLDAFDTDEALARQVYIAPMTLTLDPNLGYTYVQRKEDSVNVMNVNNSIHPNNNYGQLQMGDTLAAVIQKTR